MRQLLLTIIPFLGMRNIAIRKDTGAIVHVLSDAELTDLQKSVAGGRVIPPAIETEWFNGNIVVAGGCPHFQGFEKGSMPEGHICLDSPEIALGYKHLLPDGKTLRPTMLFIDKAKVNVDTTSGLTIAKTVADAWDEVVTGIEDITGGIMTVTR